jgi:limonene 1,2-monooxygenase
VKQRDMMDEAIGVLVPLLRGEVVSHEADWFTLRDARLQLRSFREEGIEVAVASQVSPAGARAAGKHGLGLLSIGATTTGGFNALATNWSICAERAKDFGQAVDRQAWRLVGPMHIAETREQAYANVRFGLEDWLRYFNEVAALPLAPAGKVEDAIEALNGSGFAVIGTPDDAIAQLERLEEQSGGFGCFLQLAHNWADWDATKRSYELFARYVAPRFQGTDEGRRESMEWAASNRPTFMGAYASAVGNEMQKHQKEQAEKAKDAGEAA